ncbi:MAG: hypothetical protein A4E29_00130 [Methanomassiliicoccales archaeon PtaB.Bin134]|nr:MAG: hypothetical protein A4E29_00130 [Methanomassiliicoccales archaeon PtaB.Bin134]
MVMLLFASMLLAGIAAVVGTGPQVAGDAAAGYAVGGAPRISPFSISSPSDGAYFNTSSVDISWSTDPEADSYTVALDDGSPVNVGGSTSYTLTPVSDGAHTVNVTSYMSGSIVNYDSVSFTVDTVVPTLTINSPAYGSWLNVTTVNVTWSASDPGSGIKNTSVSMDGGVWTEIVTDYYEFTSLADGQHTVMVRAYDNALNYRESNKVFNIDTSTPSVTVTEPSSGETVIGSSVQMAWSGTAPSGMGNYWVRIDGGQWIDVDLNTTYTFNGLGEGQHQVALKGTSYAGNTNITVVPFSITASGSEDVTAPTVTGSPSGTNVGIGTNVVATFSEAMNQGTVVINVSGVSGSTVWSGNVATFTPAEPLAYGTTYTVNVTGEDLAGNAMSDEWTFTTLENAGTITGIIKDANGNVLAGALVALSNGMNATTDENGAFTIENVPSGVYTMTISKEGHPTVTRSVETTAGQTNDLGAVNLVGEPTGSGGIDGTIIMLAAVVLVAAMVAFLLMAGRRLKK